MTTDSVASNDEDRGRRRFHARQGKLMRRAVSLRDEWVLGKRRAPVARRRAWAEIVLGFILLSPGAIGAAVALTSVDSGSLGFDFPAMALALAGGLGMASLIVGYADLNLANPGGNQRLARLGRHLRNAGNGARTVHAGLEGIGALVGAVLLVSAMFEPSAETSSSYLDAALALSAFMLLVGTGVTMTEQDLPVLPLSGDGGHRRRKAARQAATVALIVTAVGSTVALSLGDTRGVAPALIGLSLVLIGWHRGERSATDDALRRLAADAESVISEARALLISDQEQHAASELIDLVDALSKLNLAAHYRLRSAINGGVVTYLVDRSVLSVVSACTYALAPLPGAMNAAATATVIYELRRETQDTLVREVLALAADLRHLATRSGEWFDLACDCEECTVRDGGGLSTGPADLGLPRPN